MMARQEDGYKYQGVPVETLMIDDNQSKTKVLESNGAKVKTRQPKSPRFFKQKVIAAVLAAVALIVAVALVLVFVSRDTTKPKFASCPRSLTVTVHSASEASNASASWRVPVATDNSGRVEITSNYLPGAVFPRGNLTKVTYRAVDPSGNEAFCTFQVSILDCEPNEWRCDDGTCISASLVCDGIPYCSDASDETLCTDCLDEDFLFPCDEGKKCVPVSYVCDGVEHCDDFEDERYCDDCEASGFLSCRKPGAQCFRRSDACNKVIDCPGYKDENNCYDCASIPMDQCRSILPYNQTFFPSIFRTAEESIDYFENFDTIKDCHQDLERFLCAYLFAECGMSGTPRYLCSSFCQEVQDACRTPYAQVHPEWQPLNFFCERYPTEPVTDDSADLKLCRSPFEGCDIGKSTNYDISDGKPRNVYSPNYPMMYPSTFDCTWTFQAAEGKYIVFALKDIAMHDDNVFLGPGIEATLDVVTYYYRSEVRFGKWLMNVTVYSDTAWMQFRAGPSNVARGFHFQVLQAEAMNETCGEDEFLCDVGGCFPRTILCDGYPDCYDEKDELECDGECPYYDQVKCRDGSCIHRVAVCDDIPDCDSDEENCTFLCEEDESIYINDLLICDSFNDCGNHIDELQDCDCVEGRQFDCGERCIPVNYMCDGMNDCADGSDEMNCTCSNWKRPCADGTCLPFWFFCDSSTDCSDGSDEHDCPPCRGNFFECDNKECVTGDSLCDGYFDCSDRSDEANCEDVHFECHTDSFSCLTAKICVPEHGVCDGIANCPGREDEENCEIKIPDQGRACGERNIELTAASPNFTLSYPVVPGLTAECLWLVTSPPGTHVTAKMAEDYSPRERMKVGNGHDPYDPGTIFEIYNVPADKSLVSEKNKMWVMFTAYRNFLIFELVFRMSENVCAENERQCEHRYDVCIKSTSWCDEKPDCMVEEDEYQCLYLQGKNESSPRQQGIVMVTVEGSEKYLCYSQRTWSDYIGDAICNEYGYGYMNESKFESLSTVGPITDGFYKLSKKAILPFTSPGAKPPLYTVVKYTEECPSEKVIWISCEEQECGTLGPLPRVTTGRNAVPGEVPWIVSLSHPRANVVDHYCGGTLISNKLVITAGHCVSGFYDPRVLIGATNMTSEDGYKQIRHAKRSILWPTYINYNYNDIALLELDVPISINERTRPICLPPRNDSQLTKEGDSAIVSGWGGTIPFGMTPYILQTARASIIGQENCKNFEDLSYINEKVLCCMNQYGEQNSCKGDSGGPLYRFDGGQYYLIGLVSRGGTPSCSAPRQAVVYTRISKFLDFIEKYNNP